MTNSLRLAPLNTSSVGSNIIYMHPPISPPPRSCSWRSTSPTSILPPPPPLPTSSASSTSSSSSSPNSSMRIEALTIPMPPPQIISTPPLPALSSLPSAPLPTARFPSLLSAPAPTSTPVPTALPRPLPTLPSKPRAARRKRSRASGPRELFRCPFKNCDKVSSENSNLKAHMRLHTGETPYACQRPGCGKRFRWKSSLTYHEKALHSNLRPFECESCKKRFVERRKLQLHRDWCPTLRQETAVKAAAAAAEPLMLLRTAAPITVPLFRQ